jgi:hypothetical protein
VRLVHDDAVALAAYDASLAAQQLQVRKRL